MSYPEYYKVLNVSTNASMEDIKKSYHQLAKKYHPDVNSGSKKAEDKLKIINEAYAVLSNAAKRMEYDYFGKQSMAAQQQEAAPQKQKPVYSPPPTSRATPQPVTLKILMIRYMILIMLLVCYIFVLYQNRDVDNPKNVYKAFVNTGSKFSHFISTSLDKIETFFENMN